MFQRHSPVSGALLAQAQACVEVAAQTSIFFRSPTPDNASAAREAGLRARRAGVAAAQALKAGGGLRRRDGLALSRRLAEAARETAAGAAEGDRFGVAWADLAAMAAGLRDAARDLGAALEALPDGPRCEQLVVSAKRRAAEAERRNRRLLAAALDSPSVVDELKVRTVLRRFAQAAEASQQAADCIAEFLESRT